MKTMKQHRNDKKPYKLCWLSNEGNVRCLARFATLDEAMGALTETRKQAKGRGENPHDYDVVIH